MRAEGGHRRSGTAPWAALVAVGGALGTLLRAALEAAHPAAPGGFPWTTWAVNVVGCFALGLLLTGWVRPGLAPRWWRPLIGTGFLGAFTTFSAVMHAVAGLEQDHAVAGVPELACGDQAGEPRPDHDDVGRLSFRRVAVPRRVRSQSHDPAPTPRRGRECRPARARARSQRAPPTRPRR